MWATIFAELSSQSRFSGKLEHFGGLRFSGTPQRQRSHVVINIPLQFFGVRLLKLIEKISLSVSLGGLSVLQTLCVLL